jgi:hypothetical protein
MCSLLDPWQLQNVWFARSLFGLTSDLSCKDGARSQAASGSGSAEWRIVSVALR